MRHRKDGRQFGRDTSHRRAMFRNLAANLVTHERVLTTDAKAKELRRVAEKLITKAKRLGDVAYTANAELNDEQRAQRLAVARNLGSFLPRWGVERDGTKRDLVEKVLVELSQRFKERPGGYTRIIKVGPRRGDGAAMSYIELVDAPPPGVEFEAAAEEAEEAEDAEETEATEESSEEEASEDEKES